MTAQLPSKERLQEIIDVDARCNPEVRALAEFALASHEQEPVAWTSQRSLDVNDKITAFTSEESAVDYGKSKAWVNIVPLYTHTAPAPAVPDVGEFLIFTQVGGVKVATKDGKTKNHLFGMGWNACRAAMLNGGKS